MRNVIKKILKEEESLDWIKQSKGEDSILDFVNDRMRVPKFNYMLNWDYKKLYNQFDEIRSAMTFLEGDLEMAHHAARELNKSTKYDDLVGSLGTIEDYAMVGNMVESIRFGLYFFQPFLEETEYPLYDILEYLTKHYNS